MGLMPSLRPNIVAFLNPALCANTEQKADSKESPCQNAASLVCVCKLVQIGNLPHHKKICKSDLMKGKYVPGWIKQDRLPSWVSDSELPSQFGVNQYLWGNMPAVDMLNMEENEGAYDIHRDMNLLFAASGDIRNIVESITQGLLDGYDGRCTLVINDINFMVVARNAILLFVALSLEPDEAVPIMIHVWYSAHHVIWLCNDLEAFIAIRLSYLIESTSSSRPPTSADIRGRSVDMAPHALVERIHIAWNRGKVASALFLDVGGAFDNVSHARLLHKLRQ
ncbi:MAG: hypothetical protein Q9179_004793 [Wetmoreana sp. 5 TL-2023]